MDHGINNNNLNQKIKAVFMPRIPKAARAKQKDKHRKKIAKKIKQNKREIEGTRKMTKNDYIEKITQNLEHLTKDELKDVSILTTAQFGVRLKVAEKEYWEKEIADLKSQLQQQALPVVPECVAKFVSGDENELSKADRIAYLLKSVQGNSYYLTEELPGDGTITVDEGQELYNWAICQHHETILKLWNGYTVEKPQLFYLKNKITESYLYYDEATKLYSDIAGNVEDFFGTKTKFTQSEIDSMHAESYEQIEVTE